MAYAYKELKELMEALLETSYHIQENQSKHLKKKRSFNI